MRSRRNSYLLTMRNLIVLGVFVFIIYQLILTFYPVPGAGFSGKTFWDWMELLIIPLVLAIGAFFLNQSERAVERQATKDRVDLEREIAKDRQQEAALQAYLDRMSELLLDKKLRTTKAQEVRDVARVRTLTVLRNLDGKRKGTVINFLYEAKLISTVDNVVDIKNADLSEADLSNAYLYKVNLSNTNLRKANLSGAHLHNAMLNNVILEQADLRGTTLGKAILTEATMNGVIIGNAPAREDRTVKGQDGSSITSTIAKLTSLDNANLYNASLQFVDFKDIELTDAILDYADLTGATITQQQLASAKSLKKTILPDGTQHE